MLSTTYSRNLTNLKHVEIFKSKGFAKFARQQRISDRDLCNAVDRATRGIIDADLGGGVIKQRIPRPNAGRSGGFRTIVFFREGERTVFVYGFAKNEKDNISSDDLATFKRSAQVVLTHTQSEVEKLVAASEWIEVVCDEGTDLQEPNSGGNA